MWSKSRQISIYCNCAIKLSHNSSESLFEVFSRLLNEVWILSFCDATKSKFNLSNPMTTISETNGWELALRIMVWSAINVGNSSIVLEV